MDDFLFKDALYLRGIAQFGMAHRKVNLESQLIQLRHDSTIGSIPTMFVARELLLHHVEELFIVPIVPFFRLRLCDVVTRI